MTAIKLKNGQSDMGSGIDKGSMEEDTEIDTLMVT